MPTLVQLCQRGECVTVMAKFTRNLGMRFDLVKPILENCTAEMLLRLEQASPVQIWKGLCFRTSMKAAQICESDQGPEPESWRDQWFALQEMEAQRFEDLKSRLRTIRQEADDRKKESGIKLTDRLPPAKRGRPWGATYQPKTLIQRTRTEAARMQKGVYVTPMIPMKAKTSCAAPSVPTANRPMVSSSATISTTPSGSSVPPGHRSGSRVTVTAVAVRRTPASGSPPAMKDTPPSTPLSAFEMRCSPPSTSPPATCHSPPSRPVSARSGSGKKDPMSIFIPKHRAHSQLPSSRDATRT
ncbi:uncharacterized protein B0H18DRAFT_872917 [Fomitopsis serialis]|uniref:uncharacterized protein n=1 Tax=Fomitopsis serialis TaxID=139415 RepID=UPI002007CB9B|nr:uncharacterized protein B0H18DRAFT_872917 [Neoantrodia serialis]KAH9930617.1 hypothetical protein B0H18DRAFT_872917 [Neoantrodia serialis]